MHRFRLPPLLCLSVTLAAAAAAAAQDAPGALPAGADKVIADKLAVQTAMLQGRDYLRQGEPAKAVAVLEAELARIDGSRAYLMTLRDAYQALVTDLCLHKQEQQARTYLERLRILDPAAAAALQARPATRPVAARPAAPAPAAAAAQGPPAAAPASVPPPLPGGPAAPQTKFRLLRGEDPPRPAHDPFAKEQELPHGEGGAGRATELLARARQEFARARYEEARLLFEQAHQADKASTGASGDQWAYCKIRHAVDELNREGGAPPADLESEVRGALAVTTAPKLRELGKSVLDVIGQRRRAAAPAVVVRHYADERSGLQVAESAHFRVLHRQSREYAEKVARIAEQTRLEMARKWLGGDAGDWRPKCDVYLHATAAEYTRATDQSAASPGHSRFDTDEGTGRVVSRQMHLRCDFPGMLESVLPHETTHVVIAGQFGSRPPPWADEGIAVLSEPAEKVAQHRQNLARAARGRDLFGVRQLMELPTYPEPRRISTFYAQSVALVDFLSRQKGPEVFCRFVRDGQREGYESALRRHYGYADFADLERRWSQDALAGLTGPGPAVAAR
jgi:hypothetical protein